VQSEISERFHRLADLPESQLGLAEGALVLASEIRPELDIDLGLTLVAELVERIRPLLDSASTPSGAVAALNHAFFELERFRGDTQQYDDPRNSDLEAVLARRRGLPITLSILYVEVARQLGLEAYGVGFPGHFLAKIVGVHDQPEREIIVDPFFARILRKQEFADRLRAAIGEKDADGSDWLQPATAHEIYVRVLNNLKMLYLRNGDGLAALGCFDRNSGSRPTLSNRIPGSWPAPRAARMHPRSHRKLLSIPRTGARPRRCPGRSTPARRSRPFQAGSQLAGQDRAPKKTPGAPIPLGRPASSLEFIPSRANSRV